MAQLEESALKVEALLFASGRPLSVKEITEAVPGLEFHEVQSGLKTLEKSYDSRHTALEVRHVGEKYALQLREAYVPSARSVMPTELAARTLKALTLIAYHQPILQSKLVRMFGEPAYEEVGRLRGLGLIHASTKGSTLELTTTRQFAEYFGIASGKPEEIRLYLERKLGVSSASPAPPTETPALATRVETSSGSEAIDGAAEAPMETPAAPPTP
jgi:segregation and condensation protein B